MRHVCRHLNCKREFDKPSHRNQHEKDAHEKEPAQTQQRQPCSECLQRECNGECIGDFDYD